MKKILSAILAVLLMVPFALAQTQVNLATQVKNNLAVTHLNSGINADATTYWRGDGSWATPPTGGGGGGGGTGLDVNIKGGIIGGYTNANSDAIMLPFSLGNTTSTRFHLPKTIMLLGVTAYIDTSMPQGTMKEFRWGRSVVGSGIVSDATTDAVTVIMPGSAPGSYSQTLFGTSFMQGESILATSDALGTGATIRGWAGDIRGTATQILGSTLSGATVPLSSIRYVSVGSHGAGATAEEEVAFPIPVDITFDVLCIRTNSSQSGTGDLVATMRRNGNLDEAVTITVPAGSAAGLFCDTTHTAAYADTNWLAIKLDNQATSASAGIDSVTFSGGLTAPYTAIIPFPDPNLVTLAASQTRYMPPYAGLSPVATTESDVRGPMPRAGTGSDPVCYVLISPDTATTTAEVIWNGAGSGMTISIPTTTPPDSVVTGVGTIAFTALDYFDIAYTAGAGTPPTITACAFALQ